jgi:hypothetical protein
MAHIKPDPRQLELADDYKGEWYAAEVTACTATRLTVRVSEQSAVYRISGSRAPFGVGVEIEVCPHWSLARHGQRYVVILELNEEQPYPAKMSPALPADARDWSPSQRAGWLYGMEQMFYGEDWIDVSFEGLRNEDDFEDWAHYGYIRTYEALEADAEDDEDEDEDGDDDE